MTSRTLQATVVIRTFGVTLARSMRAPNQFAEAHWLLDYRFGFTKRGLVGSLCNGLADLVGARMSESAILLLSAVITATLSVAVILLLLRMFSNVTRLLRYLPAFALTAAAAWNTSPKAPSGRPVAA